MLNILYFKEFKVYIYWSAYIVNRDRKRKRALNSFLLLTVIHVLKVLETILFNYTSLRLYPCPIYNVCLAFRDFLKFILLKVKLDSVFQVNVFLREISEPRNLKEYLTKTAYF